MVSAAHRGSHRCAQGDRKRLPKSSRSGGVPAWVGTPSAGKTGHTDGSRVVRLVRLSTQDMSSLLLRCCLRHRLRWLLSRLLCQNGHRHQECRYKSVCLHV
jgi:hypothetical protein